jgi:hypothetical protein
MDPGTVVLLHSPLVGVESWGALPGALARGGVAVLAPRVDGDDRPPYARRYAEAAAAAVLAAATRPAPRLVLVGHSGAGPLLPAVGAALRAGGLPPGGYLFCDAGLPPASGAGGQARLPPAGAGREREGGAAPPGGGSTAGEHASGQAPGRAGRGGAPTVDRLDLLAEEDQAMAAGFRAELAAGGRFPEWSDRDLEPLVPDPGARGALVASLRPRRLDFFTEPLPVAAGWPDAPCGYLRLSAAYDTWLERAAALGWPTARLEAGHFHALVDPDGVAGALVELLAQM